MNLKIAGAIGLCAVLAGCSSHLGSIPGTAPSKVSAAFAPPPLKLDAAFAKGLQRVQLRGLPAIVHIVAPSVPSNIMGNSVASMARATGQARPQSTVLPNDAEIVGVVINGGGSYTGLYAQHAAYGATAFPLSYPSGATGTQEVFAPLTRPSNGGCFVTTTVGLNTGTQTYTFFVIFDYCQGPIPTLAGGSQIDDPGDPAHTFRTNYISTNNHGFPVYATLEYTPDAVPSSTSTWYLLLYNFHTGAWNVVAQETGLSGITYGYSVYESLYQPGPCPGGLPTMAADSLLMYNGSSGQYEPLAPTMTGTTSVLINPNASTSCFNPAGSATNAFTMMRPNSYWKVSNTVTSPSPLVITAGGTYSGTWQSLDPTVPAVQINTTDPVTLTNCTIRSKSDLIQTLQPNAHVTVRNCRGYGLDPGVAGLLRGSFFHSYEPGSLTIEHNYIEATSWGVRTVSGTEGWATNGPVIVRYNEAKNLDGAPSDGNGGRDLSHLTNDGGESNGNHFAILDKLQNSSGAEIAWNQVVMDPPPGINSIGDVINIYSSSGTPALPIQIHDNFISGGYPAHPYSTTYYGGGIITDGRDTDTASSATAYVKIHDNQVVAHSNYDIAIAAGHDNEIYSNRVVSTGQYPDGAWYDGYAGITIINNYKVASSVFYNNFAHDNVGGIRFEWAYPSAPNVFAPPPVRLDYIFDDCAGGASGPSSMCTNNASLPDPITSATEANELALWQQKVAANGVTLGPTAIASKPFR